MIDTASVRAKHDPVLDGMKFVAAAAIVLHHAAAFAWTGGPGIAAFLWGASYPALFFFFMVSGYFHGPLGDRGGRWLGRRAVRLGIPYAVWSLVYLVASGTAKILVTQPSLLLRPYTVRLVLFAGAAEVLWSLPVLMLCAAMAELLVGSSRSRRVLIVLSALGVLATYLFVIPRFGLPTTSLRQFVQVARWALAYLLGMELRATPPGRTRIPGSAALAFTGVLTAGVVSGLVVQAPAAQAGLVLIDCAVALLAIRSAQSGENWLRVSTLSWGGSYLLGVYVSHYLWIELLARAMPPSSWPVGMWIAASWAGALLLSLATTKLLLTTSFTRPTVA